MNPNRKYNKYNNGHLQWNEQGYIIKHETSTIDNTVSTRPSIVNTIFPFAVLSGLVYGFVTYVLPLVH